ncbi:MAG: murein biosynthesis integral membrane protein MurJ [Verrucomicrobia bacterium]|nr:murein biosynthesis integral membrane protein MurJ [Verrucomicrobiota bacterium]
MSQMLKSSGSMGAATLLSRVLGMVREMVYAHFLGTKWVASAFFLAFTIPNLFRRLLGEGALTAAFIPLFKEKEKKEGDREMWRAANAVISGLVVAASILIGLTLLGISITLAVGTFTAKTRLMLELLRVMFPYLLLVCLAATFMGMLNARGHFFIPAMGATMLNLAMIASVLFLAPHMGSTPQTQIFGLAIGVLVAGVAQAGFQLPTLRREGYRFEWIAPWKNETVRQVVQKMLPGTIGVAAFQINVALTYGFAFWYGHSIVASFNYAVRLMELPQGVCGISLATYLLPTLTGLATEKKFPEFRATLKQGVSYLIFINLLASVLLLVLAEPIVRLLFERGEFDAASTYGVAWTVATMAPGLIAFSLVNILARAFYALGDIQTPMRISVACLALNLVFALWAIVPFHEAGLGAANTMSALFNVWLLLHALRVKMPQLVLQSLFERMLPMLGAAAGAAALAWTLSWFWERNIGHEHLPQRIGAVFVPAISASLLYVATLLWLKIGSAWEIFNLVSAKLHRSAPTDAEE